MYLSPKRFLNDAEFREYLKNIRKIAVFDKEVRKWRIDCNVVISNVKSKSELTSIIQTLKKYVDIPEELEDELYRCITSLTTAYLNSSNLSFKLDVKVPRSIFDQLSAYCKYHNGRFYLKDPGYVSQVEKILEKYGIKLVYNRRLIESIRLKCTVRRSGGNLILKFNYYCENIVRRLNEVCTVEYYIEKPIFDEAGNYVETRIVKKMLKFFKFSMDTLTGISCIGLLDRILDVLRAMDVLIIYGIEEKEDIKLNLKCNFKLLPHQELAYELWSKRKRGTIAIFTRGGKSFIALKAIYDTRKPTIIFVTTRELAHTWMEYLSNYLGLNKALVGYLGEGIKKIREITVAIYNSAVKNIDLIRDKFELAIFDEGHHVPANTFKTVAVKLDALYRMALSATPERRDKNHTLLFAFCGPLLVNISYEQLVKLRIVAPIEVFKTVFAKGPEDKIKKLIDILSEVKGSKVIIFTQYVDTAKELWKTLIIKGFSASLITGETDPKNRKFAFRDFLKGNIKIIVTTTVLDEGVTVPDAEVAIIYEGSGEPRQMIQRIGRVLGYYPGKTAKVYELIDITNSKEKRAYFKRKWVKELYIFPGIEKYVEETKRGALFGERSEKLKMQTKLEI